MAFLSILLGIILLVGGLASAQLPLSGVGKKPSGAASTTFDPGTLTGPVSLSGGNLVATATSGAAGNNNYVYTTTSFSSGKKGFSYTFGTVTDFIAIGVFASTNAVVYYNNGTTELGTPFVGGASMGDADPWTTGNTVLFMVDFGANLTWAKVGAGNWNNNAGADPATGTGGFSSAGLVILPAKAYVTFGNSGNSVTANFSGTGFPSGFTPF